MNNLFYLVRAYDRKNGKMVIRRVCTDAVLDSFVETKLPQLCKDAGCEDWEYTSVLIIVEGLNEEA